jgi:error-prone DNA polymerase
MSWYDTGDGVDHDAPGGRAPRSWGVRARLQAAANDAVVHEAAAGDGWPAYAELHCLSDFSFLRGASSAEALFARARDCGYEALAITDECSLAGIVRAWEAAQATGLKLVVGSEFALADGPRLVLLVEDAAGYGRLCALITTARRAAAKGRYRLRRADLEAQLRGQAAGLFALWLPAVEPDEGEGRWLKGLFGARAFLAVELHRECDDAARLSALLALAGRLQLAPLASGDVHMATRRERIVQDTLAAIRHGVPLAEAGAQLFRNGERHLRMRRALGNIYPAPLLQAAVELARRCRFDLKRDVHYAYPVELVPDGHTPTSWLRALVEAGIARRWPGAPPPKVRADIEHELALIAELKYETFFLTVHDVVAFARSRGILCQGRGSSANSAVCYALGITAVDPGENRLLIARFLSKARDEPPDIDVDFEHERREEVLQYVYAKYGRGRAALAATVIRYRGKSAVRDVAKAFGLPPDQIALLANCYGWGNGDTPMEQRIAEAGFDLDNPLIARVLAITARLVDHPRHLSQHVGGFVISDAPLSTVVPVENAAMAERTIIQWDKDDLKTMGLLKVDCLALGMLTCIRKALDLVRTHRGRDFDLAGIPAEDPATYAMIQRADTVGVFQIESRAQMAMLPRLKPATFYDLVIEVAIVRPGPIQGDMVHPYLRRRQGQEPVSYPSDGVKAILGKTLGIPLFQEQVMELVIHAGYLAHEADALRRSMAAWRRGGDMEPHRKRIRELMEGKGYASAFIDQIFEQIKGFGSYGFPQSHAASFAKLVYASCWLKRHEPAAFYCGLLNAQPMGFYSPSQIVQDARRGNGARAAVEVLPVDVMHSHWDNVLVGGRPWRSDADPGEQPAIRLGLRQVAGLSEAAAAAVVQARAQAPFASVADLCLRAGLDGKARSALAEAGALQALAGNRNAARWAVAGVEPRRPLLPGSPHEAEAMLPAPRVGQEILADYRSTGLTLQRHPMALLRPQMQQRRILGLRELRTRHHGCGVHVAGLVTQRQRPGTAKGTVFVTLEDEHGMINVIVWPQLTLRCRRALLESRLLAVRGRWERVDGVEHLIAGDLYDLSELLGELQVESRDFH